MEKVVTGNLRHLKLQEKIANEKLSQYQISDSISLKLRYLERELQKLEQEYINETIKFLTTKNEYGVDVITGVSSCIYVPSFIGMEDYSYKIIMGEKGRNNHSQINENTIFDIASITKLFTLILLLKLDDLGYLSLDEKVSDINPDIQGLEDFTLNDLMRLHGKYWTDGNIAKSPSKEESERILKTIHLTDNTRKENTYNDFGAIIIADSIAKRMSKVLNKELSYEDVLYMYLLKPLGMEHTCYNPKIDNVSGNGLGTNIVHDPKARALGGMCGHAGLFTNAEDLKLLAKDIFDAEEGKGKVLNKKIVRKLGEETFPKGEHPEKGNLGVYVKTSRNVEEKYVSKFLSKGSFAHQGWTGTIALFDPYNKVHQSILVNSIYPLGDKEQLENDKPVFFLRALRHYNEKMSELGLKMRTIKNKYDEYTDFIIKTEEMNEKNNFFKL